MKQIALLCFAVLCIAPGTSASDIRIAIHAEANSGLSGKLVSLLSREIRNLQGVIVTDDQPQFRLSRSVITVDLPPATRAGYAASTAIISADGHLLSHFVHVDDSLESLAHEVALQFDGHTLEPVRRADSARPKAP